MVKALFNRHQRVWVEAVGAWAAIERILPVWTKGFDEPVKITYDVGLGREFSSNELRAEDVGAADNVETSGAWRLMRARNKWQTPDESAHHPFPGTFPIIVTDVQDWGGWRTPGAEYDRDPGKIEFQARLITSAPPLMKLARDLVDLIGNAPDDAPAAFQHLAKRASALLRSIEAG